jgi:hypothetical protein
MSKSLPTIHQRKNTCPFCKALHSVQNPKAIDTVQNRVILNYITHFHSKVSEEIYKILILYIQIDRDV